MTKIRERSPVMSTLRSSYIEFSDPRGVPVEVGTLTSLASNIALEGLGHLGSVRQSRSLKSMIKHDLLLRL